MDKWKCICALLTFMVLLLLHADNTAYGFQADFKPAFSWQIYHEDNVGGGSNEVEDFSNRYRPGLEFRANFSRFLITGKTDLEIVEYIDEKDWNYVDQRYNITAAYTASSRFRFSISGQYSVETDPDRYFETGDSDLGTEDGYVIIRHKDKREFFYINSSYSLSRRSRLMFGLGFSEFDTGVTNSSEYYNFISTYKFSLTRKTELRFNFLYKDIRVIRKVLYIFNIYLG